MRRLARSPKRNKRKVVSGSRVTLPENFAYKPELSFNPLARVTLAVGSPYLLVNRALVNYDLRSAQRPVNGIIYFLNGVESLCRCVCYICDKFLFKFIGSFMLQLLNRSDQ